MKNFMMSKKFNKQSYSDFDLYEMDGKYFRKIDGSEWIPCLLYDFGWGKENGFYKVPLGNFADLIKIVLDNSDDEDSYAAAAIIMDYYVFELKTYLLDLISTYNKNVDYGRLCSIFKLEIPLNRTIKEGMNFQNVDKEYSDWKKISQCFNKFKK